MRSSKSRSRSKQHRPRPLGNIVNRVFDSSGPEGKVRGTPQQIIEKYLVLARDAQLSNDRVAAENFLQHAEHYTRMLAEAQREQQADQEARRQPSGPGHGWSSYANGNGQGTGERAEHRDRDDRPGPGRPPEGRGEGRGEGRSQDARGPEARGPEVRGGERRPGEARSGDRPEGSARPERTAAETRGLVLVFPPVEGDEESGLVVTPEMRTEAGPAARLEPRGEPRRDPAPGARRPDQPRGDRPRPDQPRGDRPREDQPAAAVPADTAPAAAPAAEIEAPGKPRRSRSPKKPKAAAADLAEASDIEAADFAEASDIAASDIAEAPGGG